MSTLTTNLLLTKPDLNETGWGGAMNTNLDIIDSRIAYILTQLALLSTGGTTVAPITTLLLQDTGGNLYTLSINSGALTTTQVSSSLLTVSSPVVRDTITGQLWQIGIDGGQYRQTVVSSASIVVNSISFVDVDNSSITHIFTIQNGARTLSS